MRDLKELSISIKSAKAILDDMIVKAKEQGAKNFDTLFYCKDGLCELSELLESKESIDDCFMEKWDALMGWAPRVFEDHPLLDLLRNIDNTLMKGRV